jgi:hypothetical protein
MIPCDVVIMLKARGQMELQSGCFVMAWKVKKEIQLLHSPHTSHFLDEKYLFPCGCGINEV